ncbi:uncharacterized protein PODANS_2_9020 [Podospora anserina S mat+]|uniref:Nucleoside diphosphate kinase n=1 Tax=Podospora anserina (strain S / ATCC MYA-4624 / DSM 980 / FGSC 10383) TaxID=515849 RepID=B2B6V2_PODAN|nr:uncharacterized protein PODANS_2_9020 [Podospora anserina S mat+]CAP73529.1 unnamed protein product [Podospora anserina S mat+]
MSTEQTLHCYQARWRPAWPRWSHHLSLREPWLQARCPEARHPRRGAPPEALRGPQGQALLPWSHQDMSSGPIAAMVWEGRDAVKTGRVLLGATNPLASAPGTIRGDFAIDVGRNVCHGSDSVENAKKEIALWFKPEELNSYKAAAFDWVYEKA